MQEAAVNDITITKDIFMKRLAELSLKSGLLEFPKDERDLHILLKSAMLVLGQKSGLTEKEVNDRLETWVQDVCNIKFVDRVTLRRTLVDAGYLSRRKDGSTYDVVPSGNQKYAFDPAIDQLDPVEVIVDAREEIARRKREYMEKSKKS
jgi:hypothetical protein